MGEISNKQGTFRYFDVPAAAEAAGVDAARLPYSLRLLAENLLRHSDSPATSEQQLKAVLAWHPETQEQVEIAFHPGRVVLQDFTGVPAIVDLSAMRDALGALGGDPSKINPLFPSELVVDHSVQVDSFGHKDSLTLNTKKEYERNGERYQLLRWAQGSFGNFTVVPPATGIVHQVNLEYLARLVMVRDGCLYPDTLVGTDSHTTMINGLGVLGWGVGGIEAEAAMLGQPINLLIPPVVGVRLFGSLPAGVTGTDLVLSLTRVLRDHGVVGAFVEFFGQGLSQITLETRATIANMSPEFGSTCAIFPVDAETLRYFRLTGRSEEQLELVESYFRAQGMLHDASTPDPKYSSVIDFDLAEVQSTISGPKRPQDKILVREAQEAWKESLTQLLGHDSKAEVILKRAPIAMAGQSGFLEHGAVAVAAITSCTNTSNPQVMVAAGLLARRAVERGLSVRPWVKTSLAPGSKVVTSYLTESGLMSDLEALGFAVVGYGCTTCIGNSGPLPDEVAQIVREGDLVVVSVLSGNRNFEGRINPDVRANYLASPPLVVAYALAGTMDIDLQKHPLGQDQEGRDVFLRDLWPEPEEIEEVIQKTVTSEAYRKQYASVFEGDASWRNLPIASGDRYAWDEQSTYIRRPPFFDGLSMDLPQRTDFRNARALLVLGDTVTTDHISPAGDIPADSPAGRYLQERGVSPRDFNSYGSRRGNHEVMMRGTFANVRIKNELAGGKEGGYSCHLPSGEVGTVYDVAMKYQADKTPLIVLGGKDYGSGSSRDWAAKGTLLLGIVAVLAESFERIHRSNLVGMGVLPLQFLPGQSRAQLGLSGHEEFSILGVAEGLAPKGEVKVVARGPEGHELSFQAQVRIDTQVEMAYYQHGGILQYVLRQLASS